MTFLRLRVVNRKSDKERMPQRESLTKHKCRALQHKALGEIDV